MNEKLFSVTEAAQELNVTRTRVLQMIKQKRIRAEKIGNNWVISQTNLDMARERKPGRPPR